MVGGDDVPPARRTSMRFLQEGPRHHAQAAACVSAMDRQRLRPLPRLGPDRQPLRHQALEPRGGGDRRGGRVARIQKRCRAETHWDRQRPAAEMIGRRARSAPHDTSRHGSAILLSTPLSASPHAVRHRHAESHYGRADAPATAAAPPVAAPPRPARWVAAQPDHGAAPPRARASCRQRSVVPSARVIVRTSRPTC